MLVKAFELYFHIYIFSPCHFIILLIIQSLHPSVVWLLICPLTILYCCLACLTCFKFTFLTLVSRVVPLHPLSLHPVFHVCRLSLFSPSFSVFLSLPLLCWSLWLILKGNRESEWDLKEREELCSTQQGRPSLDWNAARKKKRKKKKHTREESFSLSLLFSFLHLSTLLFHHSWVVWYLTFTLLQQGLGSKSSERKLVSPLSYSVIPLFLFPLPLPFLLCYFFFPSSNRRSL